MIGSAGSFWLLVLTSSSDANSALSLFGIVCRAVGNEEQGRPPKNRGGGQVVYLPFPPKFCQTGSIKDLNYATLPHRIIRPSYSPELGIVVRVCLEDLFC